MLSASKGHRLTLLQTFSLLSALILALIAALLAAKVQSLVEEIALKQETTLALGQAESLLHAGLLPTSGTTSLSAAVLQHLAWYTKEDMGYGLNVRVKIWNPDGRILYSDAPAAIGKRFPPDDALIGVLNGRLPSAADLSDLSAPENATERGHFSHLLEVYVPIVVGRGPHRHIAGAYEIYHDLRALDAQIADLRRNIWLYIGAGFAVLYLSLFVIVQRASRRLVRQSEENARLLVEARRGEADATLLYQIGERFRVDLDRGAVFSQILSAVCGTFGYSHAALLLHDPAAGGLVHRAGAGNLRDLPLERPIPLGAGLIGRAGQTRRIVHVPDVHADPDYVPGLPETAAELAVPLLAGEELIGVLNVESAMPNAFGERDIKVLSVLADQAAMAIQNATLFSRQEVHYLATLDAMSRTIDARDPYTAGHSQRVAAYAVLIGRSLGLEDAAIRVLERGGALHDIGKIGVSDAILKNPGRLSPREEAEMRRHPVIGYELLRDMGFLHEELALIRNHHERWDGGGYPDALVGNAIPLGARILAVTDAFDAMTSDRPYRQALSPQAARLQVLNGVATQFWPPAAESLVALLDAGALDSVLRAGMRQVASAAS